MTAWDGSTRRRRLPPDWPKIRARVLRRDGYRCTWTTNGQRCTSKATDVDHIVPGDNHREDNLAALCNPHHLFKSSGEGVAARQRFSRQRPTEPHPGLRRTAQRVGGGPPPTPRTRPVGIAPATPGETPVPLA